LQKRLYRTFKSEPKLIVYPVRVIHLSSDRLVINKFSCDFAVGIPYIFVELEDKTEKHDTFNYYVKRFSFGYRPEDRFPVRNELDRDQEWKEIRASFDDYNAEFNQQASCLLENSKLFGMETYEHLLKEKVQERNDTEKSSRL